MRKLMAIGAVASLLCCLVASSTHAQDDNNSGTAPIRLIVLADDTGALHGINEGTVAAHANGIVTDTNVIVPGPWFPHIVALAKENPKLGFGVHLALTSEWSAVKWRPLTYPKTLVDGDGFFFPMVWPNDKYPPGHSVKEASPDLGEVEAELRAQIELAQRRIPRMSYLWMHMGFTSYSKDAQALTDRLADEYGLPDLGNVIDALGIKSVWKVGGPDDDKDEPAAKRLARRLEAIGPGTWMLGGHLSNDSPEMRSITNNSVNNVAKNRSELTALYSDPLVREVVKRRGIQLIPVSVVAREFMASRGRYRNPIIDEYLADPFILKANGQYYLYATGKAPDGRFIQIYRSPDLASWQFVRGAVAKGSEGAWNRRNFWAPEVLAHGGKYYLYYTASVDGTPENTGNRIGAAVSDSPEGPFEDAGVVVPHGAIDGHPLVVGKKMFMYYTIEHGNSDGLVAGQIYVDRLVSPLKVAGKPRQLVAHHKWQEGPFILRQGKRYVLTYSTGSWSKGTYAVRWATGRSPMGPFKEQPGLVLDSTDQVKGPGHHSFFSAPGKGGKSETWIVYHGWDPDFTARYPRIDPLRIEKGKLMPSGPSMGSQLLPGAKP